MKCNRHLIDNRHRGYEANQNRNTKRNRRGLFLLANIQQKLDTKCRIEGNNLFVVLKCKVFCRKLDRVGRLVGVHIDL